jgi:hypothetical protein
MTGPAAGSAAGDHRTPLLQRARRGSKLEARAASLSVVTTCTLLLMLVGATLLVSARTVIGPLLQSAAAEREARQTGAIVVTLPGGTYCRSMSFDNATAEMKEGAIQLCGETIGRVQPRRRRAFAWGSN